jgi:hypothetical protein
MSWCFHNPIIARMVQGKKRAFVGTEEIVQRPKTCAVILFYVLPN